MLHLLVEYARKNLPVEPGFAPKTARWAIVFDSEGSFLEVMELGDTSQKRNPGQTFSKAPELSFSEMKAGGETKSHFFIETAAVVALLLKGNEEEKDLVKLRAKHGYFVNLLRQASKVMPELGPLAATLDNAASLEAIASKLKEKRAKTTDKVTLAILGGNPMRLVESDRWHDWWREFRAKLNAPDPEARKSSNESDEQPMRCFITGDLAPPMKVHPKIAGLSDVGGIASGDVFASFKQDAFCSYGFEQGANAAVSEESAYAYRAALNHLIKDHGQRLAGAKVVHWFKTKVKSGDDLLPWLSAPPERQELSAQQQAKELLEAIKAGRRPDLADNHFYAVTLSGAAGRVMVRDWMEGQFADLVENIKEWFENLAIVRRDGKGLAHDPKFMAVLGSLVRDLDNLPAPFVAKMWRVAIGGERIPQQALAQAFMRARVDVMQNDPANHARMGLIKAYHIRKEGGVPMSPYLNEDHPNPAYHCGRLMAVLADVQYAALGDVGAGVVQRFYAAASSTPALVLGRLTRTSQFHLNKLDPGLARWFENRIASIWGRIKDQIPKTLSLEDQSLFALGYYQQMAAKKA